MMSNSPWMYCANRCTNTKCEHTAWVILPSLPSTFPFPLLLSTHNLSLSLSSFSPALSCSLNLSLSLCEGHAIDFPLSIHFSRLALKRGKQTKATPAPPLRSIPLLSSTLHLPSLSAAHPKTPGQEGMWRNATPPHPTPLSSHSSPSSFLPSFCLYSSYICSFPCSLASAPFQPDLWPHSTNGIKVMHHT